MDRAQHNDLVSYFSSISNRFADKYICSSDFQNRLQIWSKLIDKYAVPGDTVLDMGCGSGNLGFYLAKKGLRVIGIDASAQMIKLCECQKSVFALDNIQFFMAELPFLQNIQLEKADLIISSSVLEYIENFEETITLFCSLIKEQGILIISMPNADSLYRKYEYWQFKMIQRPKYYKHVKNVLSSESLELLLKQYGLAFREIHYYAHSPIISRLGRILRLPPQRTENLFVAVYQKVGNSSC